MEIPFQFPSKLLVGLQNVNNTSTFSEVVSCLRFWLTHTFLGIYETKYRLGLFHGLRHMRNVGGMCGNIYMEGTHLTTAVRTSGHGVMFARISCRNK
jgi:hypothetical protein